MDTLVHATYRTGLPTSSQAIQSSVEGIVVRFNQSHFNQGTSVAKWIAVFPCGNTSAVLDLTDNTERLGA